MDNSVCFIGHRKIERTQELLERLQNILLNLIENGTVNFIFGDHSEFDRLCYESVTKLKENHHGIKRIHFRCNYENANDYTMRLLTKGYEESICPKGVGNAGKASYVERNQAMIRESDVCVFYYNENYLPDRKEKAFPDRRQKSGTAIAYCYAKGKNKTVINCF